MKSEGTKERLLVATLGLISEKGYLGATTREIARKAGVTELTLFRHFGSKEKIFEGVLSRYTFLPRLRELVPDLLGVGYVDALMVIGTEFLGTLRERKALVKIMSTEITVYPEKIRRVYMRFVKEMVRTLAGFFRDLQGRGVVRVFPPEPAARAFIGMLFTYFKTEEIMRGRTISKREADRIVRDFVHIFAFGTARQK